MGVKIMRWRPWPPNIIKRFKVNIKVHSLEGLQVNPNGEPQQSPATTSSTMMTIKVKWKGSKSGVLGHHLRGSQKRSQTALKAVTDGCSINWQEDFEHVCLLTLVKEAGFLPFVVNFVVIQVPLVGAKSKSTTIGQSVLNLGQLAPLTQEIMKHTIRLPIFPLGAVEKHSAILVVSVNFFDVTMHESPGSDRFMSPSLHCLSGPLLCDHQIREMYEKKVKEMKRSVSLSWKKTSGEIDDGLMCNGKLSPRSQGSSGDTQDPSDTDSLENCEVEKVADGEDGSLQGYGHLAGVNLYSEGALPNLTEKRHYDESSTVSTSSKSSSEAGTIESSASDSDQSMVVRSLLSWKRRKLSFRTRAKGEPLLNKAYGDDGGDDIDHDRRLSVYPIEPCSPLNDEKAVLASTLSDCLDFGDEEFIVGSWEKKELMSRDGRMKLSTHVFFASIDQRSERAAGESACTALVAVIADWLHLNLDRMPIKAEFDTLIREGSAEWRKLCDVEAYRDRFPDKHFDLDTVVAARVRPLALDHARSFIGFFQLKGLDDTYNFLHGAQSFDDIWQAVEEAHHGSSEPAVYIVSWNDHFFILKVTEEAYYIIDTLGERLYEGCTEAYILRFDAETTLCRVHKAKRVEEGKNKTGLLSEAPSPAVLEDSGTGETTMATKAQEAHGKDGDGSSTQEEQAQAQDTTRALNADGKGIANIEKKDIIEYTGKDACKQFVKGFFAALPIRELQTDIKKGLLGKNTLHQRLQIEFHYVLSDQSGNPKP